MMTAPLPMAMQRQSTSSSDALASKPPSQMFQSPPLHPDSSSGAYPSPLEHVYTHHEHHQQQPEPPTHPVPTTPSFYAPSPPGSARLKPARDHKRPRACESCRALKVKCEAGDSTSQSCRRCAKANRDCIFTAPTRKRQKKADSKVAELESKIDALTARLNATKHGQPQPSDDEDNEGEDEDMGDASSSENPSRSPDSGKPPPDQQFSRAVAGGGAGGAGYAGVAVGARHVASGVTVGACHVVGVAGGAAGVGVEGGAEKHRPRDAAGVGGGGGAEKHRPRDAVRDHARRFLPPGAVIAMPSDHDAGIPFIQYVDVIDQQLLSMDMATGLFDFFNERMAPHFPAVVFPPGTTAQEIRKTRPTLFLAILAAASGGTSHPDLRCALQKETKKAFAERIIVGSEKSLELVQALLVSSLYYYPPDVFEELTFYLLIHLASSMALDIGLGAKPRRPKAASLARNYDTADTYSALSAGERGVPPPQPSCMDSAGAAAPSFAANAPLRPPQMRPKNPFPDPCTLESRRTILACFWMCSNVSLILRRPNMHKYTVFMRESVDILESSPHAVASDRVLCQWVRLQVIAMELAVAFEFDEPMAAVSIDNPRTRTQMMGFSSRLQEWRRSVDSSILNASLELNYHLFTVYTHEIVLHVDHNVDEFRPPFTEHNVREPFLEPDAVLKPHHLEAIWACIEGAQALLETFCTLSVQDLACTPVITFVRCGYACMILIKVASTSALPGSALGKLIRREELRVDEYINRALETLSQAAKGDRNRMAAKFAMSLIMMRNWHAKHLAEMDDESRKEVKRSAPPPPPPPPPPPSEPPSTPETRQHHDPVGQPQTPLQLLAEQATFQQPLHSQEEPEQQEQQQQQPFLEYLDPMVISGFVEFQAGDVALGLGGAGRDAITDDSFWGELGVGGGVWPALAGESWGY